MPRIFLIALIVQPCRTYQAENRNRRRQDRQLPFNYFPLQAIMGGLWVSSARTSWFFCFAHAILINQFCTVVNGMLIRKSFFNNSF